MKKTFVQRILFNRWIAFLHDLLLVPICFYIAYWLRFNLSSIPKEHLDSLIHLLPIALVVQGSTYWLFGLYRGFWRFASIPDLVRIIKAIALGTLVTGIIAFFVTRLEGIPRSVFILYPLLIMFGLAFPRLLYRWYKDHRFLLNQKEGKRVVVIGAGRAGELLLRDLLHQQDFMPIALIDDDVSKHGREIHGIRVIGGVDQLEQITNSLDVEEILIAIPSISKSSMQRITALCSHTELPTRILPSLYELADYKVDSSQLRPVTVEDLLGREPVKLDEQAIGSYLQHRVVLVSGGGGSIGSELCRQVAAQYPQKLVILDHGEFNLYSIDHELRERFPDLSLESVLGDVRNVERINWVFETFSPEVVFHAAAYKHVPMVEMNPAEGVVNNVIGTRVIADAADRCGSERFVLISTDKAVNPANVMGATKRVAELYCQNLDARSRTKYITTRFGNVLGSTGSVVPLFQRQIENGGPVTVTHPEIKRYFMTIPEAVNLILQAGSMGQGGEIFVLDMGDPVLIHDLAEQMIRLSGFTPGNEIEIVYTGLRPGEKLFEEIFHESEGLQKTTHTKLFLASSRKVDWNWLDSNLVNLDNNARSRNVGELMKIMYDIVPEFKHEPTFFKQLSILQNDASDDL